MSFIHPDASLMDTERSHLDPGAPVAAAADRVNGENEKQFSLEVEVERENEARASNSSPREQLQIKIVMLKVQVNYLIEQTLLVALSRFIRFSTSRLASNRLSLGALGSWEQSKLNCECSEDVKQNVS